MSTSSRRPSDEPTDEQLDRLRNAIVAHAASSPDPVEIRRRTLKRLDQSPFAALVMEGNLENPLTWCERHPGQAANVRLTVSVEDSEEWANAVAVHGTLKRIADETTLAKQVDCAADSRLSSSYFVPATGSSKENVLTLSADADADDGDDQEDASQEIDDINIDLTESIFELKLSGLPSGLRLATAEVQAMPTASLSVATGTEIWPKIAQRLKSMRPKLLPTKPAAELQPPTLHGDSPKARELNAESLQVVRTLYADNRDPALPFMVAQAADSPFHACLTNEAQLEVRVQNSAWANRHPIVSELTYQSETGPKSHRYVLNDQPASRTDDELIFRQQIRIPADAVDAEVTLSVRGMRADEICILNDSMRRELFPEGSATCGVSLRETAESFWELTAFRHDVAGIQNGLSKAILFRVEEQMGGVR